MSHKKPKSLITPHERKEPKLSAFPVDDRNGFEFKAEQMDKKGQWGWDNFESKDTREVFQRIFELQKLTWQELVKTGSHPISIQDIIPAAQKRLIEIEKDDFDELFSLRVVGRKRIWAIRERNILWLLWWDPNHEVCPSHKKHT